MTSAEIGTQASAFISGFQSILSDNIGVILTFAGGILVWVIVKKWIFGGASRV